MPWTGAGVPEGPLEPGQEGQRDPGRGLVGPLGRDQPAQQLGHRRAFVGEDPDVALLAGQGERPGQDGYRFVLPAAGRERQGAQGAGLDDAAGPLLAHRRGVQPVQQRERPAGLALGEQEPGQHQVPRLASVVRLVVRVEAAFGCPPGGGGQVALG